MHMRGENGRHEILAQKIATKTLPYDILAIIKKWNNFESNL